MENKDLAIPIVFPDYLIMVETPAINVHVPDVLPVVDILPGRIKIPSSKQKLPFLGHAGILFIEGKTGFTKYYEYGRYDPAAKGLVRKQSLADVKIGNNGRPTKVSLQKVLGEISLKSGQHGKIAGAYIELDAGSFIKMLAYANTRMKNNIDPNRPSYELLSNSCLHFMKGVAEAGGVYMPAVIAPQPAGYIVQVRLQRNDLDFDNYGSFNVENFQLN